MSEQGRESHLPRVDGVDISLALFDTITQNHAIRWEQACTDQPELTAEILKRAWELSRTSKNSHDYVLGVLSLALFIMDSFERAAERTIADGGDAAGRPPSDAPYDDQPTDGLYQAPPD